MAPVTDEELRGEIGNQARFPIEVERLANREREIATIVYTLKAATAEEVGSMLAISLANASVRSMLNRLVRKGVLRRDLTGRAYVYAPAVTRAQSAARAFRQFADDHFNGSLVKAAETMDRLLRSSSIQSTYSRENGQDTRPNI